GPAQECLVAHALQQHPPQLGVWLAQYLADGNGLGMKCDPRVDRYAAPAQPHALHSEAGRDVIPALATSIHEETRSLSGSADKLAHPLTSSCASVVSHGGSARSPVQPLAFRRPMRTDAARGQPLMPVHPVMSRK